MKSEQDLIREIAALDDRALLDGIGRVAKGMGLDPALAAAYLGDPEQIRQTVLSLTGEELAGIRAKLGEETMDQILGQIREGLGEA